MKLAVLADIHGNYQALQAVTAHIEQWQPDQVVVAGDIVNRGPRSRDCLDFVQNKQASQGWLTVRGNHEDYVIDQALPNSPRSGLLFEMHRSTYWTYQQLNGDVKALLAMPFQLDLAAPDGSSIIITHASILGTRNGIFVDTSDAELRRKIVTTSALFCVGHTHLPLIRHLDQTLVVNAGAVGLPFDRDLRAGYAQVEWQSGRWSAEIIRLDYDRRQAEQDFFDSGFMRDSGPLAPVILDEFRIARSHLYQWTEWYQARILAGEMSVEASTREYLARVNGTYKRKKSDNNSKSSH